MWYSRWFPSINGNTTDSQTNKLLRSSLIEAVWEDELKRELILISVLEAFVEEGLEEEPEPSSGWDFSEAILRRNRRKRKEIKLPRSDTKTEKGIRTTRMMEYILSSVQCTCSVILLYREVYRGNGYKELYWEPYTYHHSILAIHVYSIQLWRNPKLLKESYAIYYLIDRKSVV